MASPGLVTNAPFNAHAPNAGIEPTSLINPGQRSSESRTMLPRLELMRACYGGTETMRQMGPIFLPMHPSETPQRYAQRLAATTCFNKLQEAVDAASAKPFKNLITLNNADDELQEWMWDVDLEGHHLHILAHRFFNTAVLQGLGHILVDHPSTAHLPNLAVQRALKVRPFMRLIRPEDLLACYYERIGGVKKVVHARISSRRTVFDRITFREQIYDQVFVIEPGVVQLWERPRIGMIGSETISAIGVGGSIITSNPLPAQYFPVNLGGSWTLVSEDRITLDEVPLVNMLAGEEQGDHVVKPIFQDLAYKQIEHWRSSSDQRNVLTAARFPMLACSGINLDTEEGVDGQPVFEIGPWKILTSGDPNGRWYYVETEGKAIEAGQRDLEAIEVQMEQLSLNPIINQPGRQYIAQNERTITEARVNTVVHDLALTAKDALLRAVDFMGKWAGKDTDKVSLNMNFDFSGADQQAARITSILQAVQAKALSREAGLVELKRLNLLSDEFDIEAELKRGVDEMADPTPQPEPVSKEARDFAGGKTRPEKQA